MDSLSKKISKPIGLIKIDVEGHEFEVLKGATKLLKRDHPYLIIEDWNSKNYRKSESILLLEQLGYSEFFTPQVSSPKRIRRFWRSITDASRIDTMDLVNCDFGSPNGYSIIVCK